MPGGSIQPQFPSNKGSTTPMKTLHPIIILAAGLFPAICMAENQKPLSVDELLDRVIKDPGQYHQMCSESPSVDRDVPLPLYHPVFRRDHYVSIKNMDELRGRREEVVAALRRRLADMKFPPWKYTEATKGAVLSANDSAQLTSLHYEIIVNLDAVETLPELLRIEERLNQKLSQSENDSKTPPPFVLLDGYAIGDGKLSPRELAIQRGRIMQRELLSVMLQLLRRQQFQPLLDSIFEKIYAAMIKARANDRDLRDIKTPEDAKARGQQYIPFDPVYHIPLGYLEKSEVHYSEKMREEARSLVEAFIKTVPPEKWKMNEG